MNCGEYAFGILVFSLLVALYYFKVDVFKNWHVIAAALVVSYFVISSMNVDANKSPYIRTGGGMFYNKWSQLKNWGRTVKNKLANSKGDAAAIFGDIGDRIVGDVHGDVYDMSQ